MTEEQQAAAQARLDAITPGPWVLNLDEGREKRILGEGGDPEVVVACWVSDSDMRDFAAESAETRDYYETEAAYESADATFIAHAPDDLRAALAALKRVRELAMRAIKASNSKPYCTTFLNAEGDERFFTICHEGTHARTFAPSAEAILAALDGTEAKP